MRLDELFMNLPNSTNEIHKILIVIKVNYFDEISIEYEVIGSEYTDIELKLYNQLLTNHMTNESQVDKLLNDIIHKSTNELFEENIFQTWMDPVTIRSILTDYIRHKVTMLELPDKYKFKFVEVEHPGENNKFKECFKNDEKD